MLQRTLLPVLPVLVLVLGGLALTPAEASEPTASPVGVRSTPLDGPTQDRAMQYTTAQFESRLMAQVNSRRTKVGCPKLRLHASLRASSRAHTTRMADRHTLSHQLSGEASFDVRITRAGYRNWRMLAENIAYGSPSPAQLFSSWLHSAPHRKNIQNCGLRDVGVGVSYADGLAWATMDFGRH